VVQITFYPDIISFIEFFEIFLTIHDPTTLNHREQMWALTILQEKVAREAIKEFEV